MDVRLRWAMYTYASLHANHQPAAQEQESHGGHLTPHDATTLIIDYRPTRHSRGFEGNKQTGWPRQPKMTQTLQPVCQGYTGWVRVV